MADNDEDITLIGETNFRNSFRRFGIKVRDRRHHIYIVGKTGVGKSSLMENMIVSDIMSKRGIGVVDPHGELAENILNFVPEDRLNDVIYFNPSDSEYPIAFNPLETSTSNSEDRNLLASGIMSVFKKVWPDVWSARMEYILNNTLLALLEYPNSTLLGVMKMLSDKNYRQKVVDGLKDDVVKSFWVDEFARYTQRLEIEAVAAIQNKIGQLISNPLIRNILGQPRSSINIRKALDEGKIMIFNLSKGRIGEDNSMLLGALIITKIQLAAMSRVEIPEKDRRDFFLYVDEFQNFATDSFVNILAEARKYHLSLTLAHQYIGQLVQGENAKVRDAIFGNVGTIIVFRVGAADAEFLEKEFAPEITAKDLVNLPKYHIYIKLMIDGVASKPFSAVTLQPYKISGESLKDVIIENSRSLYGIPREVVDKTISNEWKMAEFLFEDKKSHQGEAVLDKILGKRQPSIIKSSPFTKPTFKKLIPDKPQKPKNVPSQNEDNLASLREVIKKSLEEKLNKQDEDSKDQD